MDDSNRLFLEASPGQLRQIFAAALDEPHIHQARLLDGGLFNTTYHVTYGKAREEAVLRLGPVNRHLLMGHEENLMQAEVHVCALCERSGIPSSQVLAWDCSRRIVDRDFMIVRYIPSVLMNQAELTEDERGALYREMGVWLRRFHQIEGDCYGYVSRILEGQGCSSWGDALLLEAEDILDRLETHLGYDGKAVRTAFRHSKSLLDAAGPPRLLHTDMWEGNVLLDRDTHDILAVIDGDRAVYGDPDFEFASSWMEHPSLLAGYGIDPAADISPDRRKRRTLYRLFYALLEAYTPFEKYGDRSPYDNSTPHIKSLLAELDSL